MIPPWTFMGARRSGRTAGCCVVGSILTSDSSRGITRRAEFRPIREERVHDNGVSVFKTNANGTDVAPSDSIVLRSPTRQDFCVPGESLCALGLKMISPQISSRVTQGTQGWGRAGRVMHRIGFTLDQRIGVVLDTVCQKLMRESEIFEIGTEIFSIGSEIFSIVSAILKSELKFFRSTLEIFSIVSAILKSELKFFRSDLIFLKSELKFFRSTLEIF